MTGIAYESNQLCMDGVPIGRCGAKYGTPVFVYGGDSIVQNTKSILSTLGQSVHVYYSIKANPNIAIADLIRTSGVHGAEIASHGELEAALRSGYSPNQILFAGPGKSDEELERAIQAGVGQINAESMGEIERISLIASRLKIVQRVGVRVNLEDVARDHGRINTGGGVQKFGIDESMVVQAIQLIHQQPGIEFAGLHTMLGSQVLDASDMEHSCRAAIEMAGRVGEEIQEPIPSLNLGGGLGVPHTQDDPEFDMLKFGQSLKELIDRSRESKWLSQTQYMLEPGRVLVSGQGVYVTRVLDTKESAGQAVAVVDGGIHHALLPITANSYQVLKATRDEDEAAQDQEPVLLGGPLCTSADQWRSLVNLPSVQVGDLLVMLNSGAYGLSASMNLFLSKGTPSEVLVLDGVMHEIRERPSVEDQFALQKLPLDRD